MAILDGLTSPLASPLLAAIYGLLFATGVLLGYTSRSISCTLATPNLEAARLDEVFQAGANSSDGLPGLVPCSASGPDTCRKLIPPLPSRDLLGKLLNDEGMRTGVEVGVKQGDFARTTLQQWKTCQQYILVDIWMQQTNYKDIANADNATQDAFFHQAQAKLAPFRNITVFRRMFSVDAARLIANSSMDFAYIDARHDYCGVSEDLALYWPKVRPGGIMAGHDYLLAEEVTDGQDWSVCHNGERQPGAVKGAVQEFFNPLGLQVVVTYRDAIWNTWIVRKPA